MFSSTVFSQTSFFKKNDVVTEETKIENEFVADSSAEEKSLKFLSTPVDGAYISSSFSKSRFHPVLKTWKAHKGTDFCAPYGTPIKSTCDGVVESTGFTSGNGNYVKIKHNEIYSTQYLHMSRFIVVPGQNVKMGEVIGYVGSSGLSTGSHVCYRFWKNGIQINPFEEFNINFEISGNESEVMNEEEISDEDYEKYSSGFFKN